MSRVSPPLLSQQLRRVVHISVNTLPKIPESSREILRQTSLHLENASLPERRVT